MSATDLFGYAEPKTEFKDIRPTRESVAEEKARLAFELNALIKIPPKSLNSSSVNRVREFFGELANAKKVAAAKDSSRNQLMAAINSMKRFA